MPAKTRSQRGALSRPTKAMTLADYTRLKPVPKEAPKPKTGWTMAPTVEELSAQLKDKPKPKKERRLPKNPSVAERIERSGGLGMTDETRSWLGGNARGVLGAVNNAILDVVDLPVMALEASGHTAEWLANEADQFAMRNGLDTALAFDGNRFMPGSAVMALGEAFPFGMDGPSFVGAGNAANRAGRAVLDEAGPLTRDFLADTSGELRIGRSTGGESKAEPNPSRPARHYSFKPDLTETDPSKWGSNKTPGFLPPEERRSIGKAPGRTWFGMDGGSNPYSKEAGVGPYEYEADLSGFNLLDIGENGAAAQIAKLEEIPETIGGRLYNGTKYPQRSALIERLIQDDGYDGYTLTNPQIGDVAAMFSPVPVRRVQQPLEGAPTKLGPYDPLRHLTKSYMDQNGLPENVQQRYAPADPEFHTQVAQAFEAMPHNPADPDVAEAYQALKRETLQQYQALEKAGYKFSFLDPDNDPYPSPFDAIRDLRDNRKMQVYPTDAGFGSGAGLTPEDIANNPLLETVPDVTWDGKPITYNDAFRAVHDAFGHAKEGFGFRADGENAAYLQHLPTFSPAAQRALATETLGQNSWVNFGPHGAANRTASAADTVFADQKNGLLPDEIVFGGQAAEFMPDPRSTSYGMRQQLEGKSGPQGILSNARVFDEAGLNARIAELGTTLPEQPQPAIVGQNGRPGEAYSNPSLISTRRPNNDKKGRNYAPQGDPDKELLIQTGQALKDAPDTLAKNMDLLSQEPFMQGLTGTPDELYDQAVRRGADNMRYIAEELMPPELVDSSRGWYETANGFAKDMADRYGIGDDQAAGILAALSPQNHWANNVANAEQLLQLRQGGFDGSGLGADAARLSERMASEGNRKKNVIAMMGPDQARRIMETPFEELSKTEKRHKIAMLAELQLDPTLYDIAPDGTRLGPMGRVSFGSSNEVNAALEILEGTDIGKVLAGGGKVPSFYDNIVDPNAPLPIVTTDTHHAGAFSLFPGGGDDTIVQMGMGRGAGSNSARTGSKGIYGLIADSTALAGDEMGMLPREVQSVVWEGVRGLWGGPGMKTKGLKKEIADTWRTSATPEEARRRIGILLGRQ